MDPLPENEPVKRPRGQNRKARKKIIRPPKNTPQHIRDIMASPERTAIRIAALMEWKRENPGKSGRMQGQQDGVRKKDYIKRLEKAKVTAEKAIRTMAEKNIWKADNDVAERAMRTAIEVMESQQGTTDSKLKAAKTILEFTQTKPVVKNETTIKSAEAFLESLLEDEGDAVKP